MTSPTNDDRNQIGRDDQPTSRLEQYNAYLKRESARVASSFEQDPGARQADQSRPTPSRGQGPAPKDPLAFKAQDWQAQIEGEQQRKARFAQQRQAQSEQQRAQARRAHVQQQAAQAQRLAEHYPAYEDDYDDYDDYDQPVGRRGISLGSWITLIVLLVIIGVGGWWGYTFFTSSESGTLPVGQTVEVVIPEEQGVVDVGNILKDAGVVGNSFGFASEARSDGRAGSIQPGTYVLAGGMSVPEILDVITAKPESKEVVTWNITIPEGLSAGQIFHRMGETQGSPYTFEQYQAAAALVKLPDWVPSDLPAEAQRLEGLIWPDTYQFFATDTPEMILQQLVDKTVTQVEQVGAAPNQDLYKTLTIASLVEKETAVEAERPVVSGVIKNRLEKPMRLQIDATVVYAIARATGNRPTRLTNADYNFVSPWSTYTNDGLPPTPIANVGRGALEAAAKPQETPYFYYVVNDLSAGTHAFSTTFEEHQRNVANLRKLMAERDAAAKAAPQPTQSS